MERAVALKTLGKLLGKEMGYRIDPKAPTAEERAEAKAKLPALSAKRQEAVKAMQDRQAAILAGDQELQDLIAAFRVAKQESDQAHSLAMHYKITVGKSVAGLLFMVKAQGDSWEEVIKKLAP